MTLATAQAPATLTVDDRATSMALLPTNRPRWVIDLLDIEAFERRRQSRPTPKQRARRAHAQVGKIKECV